MKKQFENKVVLVTGGSSGIGKATALAFANEGAKTVVADILVDEGKAVVAAIKDAGGEAEFILCDMAIPTDIQTMMDIIQDSYGRLDCAFNNAGIEGEQGNTIECTEENWDKVININLRSVWLCMKYQIPMMQENESKGAIVNCSSIAGLVGFTGIPAYVASKHGMVGLTKTAALEFAKEGIRINAVCPGVIKTPMIDRYTGGSEEAEAQFIAGEPIGRMGEPREIADAVLWLCSDKASFVTGQAIAVDGGWVAQ